MRLIVIIVFLFHSNCFSQIIDSDLDIKNLIEESRKSRNTDRQASFNLLYKGLMNKRKLSQKDLSTLYNAIGIFYKEGEAYYMALNYFYKELEIIKKIDTKSVFQTYNNIGGCYYNLKEYEDARNYMQKSLLEYEMLSKKNEPQGTIIYNNIGVLEKHEGNYEKALMYLNKFKAKSEKSKDTLNIIMAYENLAEVYLAMNMKAEALEHLRKGLVIAKQKNTMYDISSLSLKLGVFYHDTHNVIRDSSKMYLERAYEISKENNFTGIQLTCAEWLANLYEDDKNFEAAFKYSQTVIKLSQEISAIENNGKIDMLKFEQEDKMNNYRLLVKQKKREYILLASVVFLLITTVLIFLMFKLQKSRTRQKTIEKELLTKEIDTKNKELKKHSLQIIQNTEILKSTKNELERIKHSNDYQSNNSINKIIRSIKSGEQAFSKKDFDNLFVQIDNEFHKKLIVLYPSLTKNELRLCAFLRLNFSTKEISSITLQNPHAITVARSRLRKKLGLRTTDDIVHFLIKI